MAQRYGFIDLLRGFALVVMIETHVVNAYLPLALKKGSTFFFWLAFTNGLVAPAFLFASGFSLVLQSNHQWDNWLSLSRAVLETDAPHRIYFARGILHATCRVSACAGI